MRLQNMLFMNTISFLRLRATEGYRATENLPTLESLLCDNLDAVGLIGTTIVSFDEDDDFEDEDGFDEEDDDFEDDFDDEYDGSDEDDFDEDEDVEDVEDFDDEDFDDEEDI